MLCSRLSECGEDGDARLNEVHGRYIHTVSGIEMLCMSALDCHETYQRRIELTP